MSTEEPFNPNDFRSGDPELPWLSRRGKKRKTRPPFLKEMAKENVRNLFGPEAAESPTDKTFRKVKDQPTKDLNGKRVQSRRKKVKDTSRVGERWTAIEDRLDAEGLSMADFVKELTPTELAKGQLLAEDGTFRGAPTKWVPTEFHRECVRELMRRGNQMYQESYLAAIQTMVDLATNPIVEPKDRIKAAQFVVERIEGKVPQRLEIAAAAPWEQMLSGVVATATPNQLEEARMFFVDGAAVYDIADKRENREEPNG